MHTAIKTGIIVVLLTTGLAMANETEHKVIPNNPKHVASFDLGVVDTLDQLNIPVKSLPKQNLPNYLAKYKSAQYGDIGGLKTPDIDKIKIMKPDLIIISGRQQAQYDKLAKIAPTVNLSVNSNAYESSFKSNMLLLAKVFNKLPEMSKVLSEIDRQAQILQQQAKDSPAKALIVVHYKGSLMAVEQSNYAGLIHGWLGIKGVDLGDFKKNNKAERLVLSSKDVVSLSPDILFVIDRGEAIGEGKIDKKQLEDIDIQQTNAYKNKKIIYLTPDLWYLSGNGLQSIKLQMQDVAQAFN